MRKAPNKVHCIPNLRFPGFEGEEHRPYKNYFFKDIFLFSTGKNIKQDQASPEFEIPCVRYGELYYMYNEVINEVINRTNLDTSELLFSQGNEILLPSAGEDPLDIGLASALAIENVAIGRTINILRPMRVNVYSHIYVSYYINQKLRKKISTLAKGSSISNVYNSDLKTLEIILPNIDEQTKIASFLSLIDLRIQTQSKTIEALKALKAAVAKKIFTQQLRFKDEEGESYPDWEVKKLGDVTRLVNKRNNNNEKLPVYSINNKIGFVPQSEQFEGVDSDGRGYDIKLYKLIDKNTFAYNPARINVGSIGYSWNLGNIIISSLYVCFKTKEMMIDEFLFQYLKTTLFNREVLRNVEGGVRDYLFYENFSRIKLCIPCLQQQTKIANFLSSIDSKINIEIQLLQKLEEQKKYLLQNLFV